MLVYNPSGWAPSSNNVVDYSAETLPFTKTAPAAGWFFMRKIAGISSAYIGLQMSSSPYMRAIVHSKTSADHLGVFLPVKKGQKVEFQGDASGAYEGVGFAYSEYSV